jgi:hypothetical protein
MVHGISGTPENKNREAANMIIKTLGPVAELQR